jgi:hypothetical protein
MSDGHHGWMMPALECSLAVLIAALLLCAGESLLKARILVHTPSEQSCAQLWLRMSLLQTALFTVMEQAEGGHAGFAGAIVQIVVALLAAYLLSLFAHLVVTCACGAHEASQFLRRLLEQPVSFVSRRPAPIALALAVNAGTARFQRPPPFA